MIISTYSSLVLLILIQASSSPVYAGPIDSTLSDKDAPISYPLVNINVTDHNGADASHRLTLRHYSSSLNLSPEQGSTITTEAPSISPRDFIFTPAGPCPPDTPTLLQSRCLSVINKRAYRLICIQRIGLAIIQHSHYDQCGPGEVCIDNLVEGVAEIPRAWCVNVVNMALAIVQGQQGKKTASIGAKEANLPAGAGPGFIAEVFVTGTDTSVPVVASTLSIEAQHAVTVHEAQYWQTLDGGSNQCVGCSNVELANVPVGTQRFNVNVQLQDPNAFGVVHLVAFSPSILG